MCELCSCLALTATCTMQGCKPQSVKSCGPWRALCFMCSVSQTHTHLQRKMSVLAPGSYKEGCEKERVCSQETKADSYWKIKWNPELVGPAFKKVLWHLHHYNENLWVWQRSRAMVFGLDKAPDQIKGSVRVVDKQPLLDILTRQLWHGASSKMKWYSTNQKYRKISVYSQANVSLNIFWDYMLPYWINYAVVIVCWP